MRINWGSHAFIKEDGYGRYAMHLIRNLGYLGYNVTPFRLDWLDDMPGWMLRQTGLQFDRLTIQSGPADQFVPLPGPSWGLSMTEDSRIPAGWSERINNACDLLIVPCEHNRDAFARCGVRIPIHVIPGGTEPAEFPLMPEVERETFTFLCLGDRGSRKGLEVAYMAFFRAFKDNPDVRLVIKARPSHFLNSLKQAFSTEPRISFWLEDVDTMADVYAAADCFLFPSYGEGWGMPPREAAMMGLPVIASRHSGLLAGIDQWAIPLEQFSSKPSQLPQKGMWDVPNVEEVAEKMIWVNQNRAAARAKGQAAAQWLRENQTWQHCAKLIDLLICPEKQRQIEEEPTCRVS